MRKVLMVLLGAWLVVNCNLFERATVTPALTETPTVYMRLSEATSFKNSVEIAVGGAAQVTIISEPVLYSVSRADDGRVESSSMKPWAEHNLSQMRTCVSLDEPCQLAHGDFSSGDWEPFDREQQVEIDVDWIGPRQLFAVAEYLDDKGNIVLSIGGTSYEEPQLTSQATYTLIGFWDESIPLRNLPAPAQTSVSATQSAYPVSGSVVWESDRCCAGGAAGETIHLRAEFSAESPFGEVTGMRAATGGICRDEADLSGLPWEPFVPSRSYPVQVALNWVGHYVSVQYRDEWGNLSPVYCDDISVEGSPSLSPSP